MQTKWQLNLKQTMYDEFELDKATLVQKFPLQRLKLLLKGNLAD